MPSYLMGLLLGIFCFVVQVAAHGNSLSSVYLGSRENDPASLVENVSTIYGDYTEVEVDLTVPAPDSLTISRFYSSRDTIQIASFGGWRFNPQCFLSIRKDPKGKSYTTAEGKFELVHIYVGNPDGAILTYVGWQNTTTLVKRSLFKIDPEENSIGLCNTAKGNISSWTNLKNNELYFDPQTDSFELLLCSKGKRFYAKHPSLDVYLIHQEILPSGNKLFYEFDNRGQLSLIKETNASEKKVLAWIKIQYEKGIHVETSDGKTADYLFQQDPSGAQLLTSVIRSNKPSVQYQYQIIDNRPLLVRKTLPEGRFIQLDYFKEKNNQYKVRSLAIPVGPSRLANIQFSYEEGSTTVDGPGNSKAVYRFNDTRLVALEHYLNGSLYRVHKKDWGVKNDAGNLISTSIEDGNGNTFYHKSFKYDETDEGNIIEEREYGDLKGADATPLNLDENGGSHQAAHVKTYSYFSEKNSDGFVQKDEKGTGLKCWYRKGTNLLIKKFITSNDFSDDEDNDSEIKKRYFYDYNEDAALVRTIVDDGGDEEAKKLYDVRERHITLISPKQEIPNVGAPELIQETYLDLSKRKEVLLKSIANQFDDQGFIVSQAISDANGAHCYTLKQGYANGLLQFETDPMENEIHYSYDANLNLTHMSRSDTGISMEYEYDLRNRLISTLETDRMGNQYQTEFTYDTAGYKILEVDRFGNETIYVNDSLGRPVQITFPDTSDGIRSSTRPTYKYTYGLFDNLLSVTDPRGRLVTTSFNARGQPTTIQHLDGRQELFKYDHEGSLHRYLGRDGLVQVFEYDYIGRLNHIEYYKRGSKGSEEGFKRKYYNYNAFHLISEEDERRNKTTYTYDGAGRLAILSKGDQKIEFIYDALGRTQGIKKWNSSNAFVLETKEYDLLNRVTEQQIRDSQGHTLVRSRYIYNAAGQLTQIIGYPQNEESILVQYEYDGLGRPSKITGASNQVTTMTYNDFFMSEWGQRCTQRTLIDPLGNQTEEIFDNAGHLIKISKRDKAGLLLSDNESSYDLLGNKVFEKVARLSEDGLLSSYETEWAFDEGNQLRSLTLGKGTSQERTTAFEYNNYGDLGAKYNPGSNEPITYRYNSHGNLKTISYKEGKKEVTHQLSFDMNSNLTEMRLLSSQILTYSYDKNDLLLSETVKDEFGSYQVRRTYDRSGNIQTLHLPDGSSVQYTYEGPFVKSVARLSKSGKETYQYRVISRDQMGNVLEEILPGYGGGRNQVWDASSRRTKISTDFFQDKVLEGGYDHFDHIKKKETSFEDKSSILEYGYNALFQLISEKGEEEYRYSYDSLGNRLQRNGSPYKVDNLNQLVEAEGFSYTFDANGNLATKTTGQQTWTYQWDALNHLISIKDPDQNIVSFTYDLNGRRLTKKIESKGKKATILRFFYLRDTEIGSVDDKGTIVELKIPSNPNHPEISPCVAIEVRRESYVPLYDLQGNIACLLDHQKRSIVESYRYSSFGEEEIINGRGKVVSVSSIGNPWRYRGKRVDAEVGLVYFGSRYYDPEIGRWISPDLAGDLDGPNLYAFARNNPINYVDYFGLASEVNGNQSKEFNDYFYGEYEPHCHCEAHRTCKRGGDIGTSISSIGANFFALSLHVADFILHNPRFQGTVQALGGLAEASVGGGMTLATAGAVAPFGWPVMAHGLDQLITGISRAVSGPKETLTSQLLQKTGVSDQTASLIDSGLSMGGAMGAAAIIRSSHVATLPNFRLPAQRLQTTLYRAVQPAELVDIQKTGIFRNLGDAEGKYFTTSLEGASSYAKKAVTSFGDPPYTLVKTQVSDNFLNGVSPTFVDGGIPAWVISEQSLKGLIPEIVTWMAVPK